MTRGGRGGALGLRSEDARFRWAVLLPTVGLIALVVGHSIHTVASFSTQSVSTFALDRGTYVGLQNWVELFESSRTPNAIRNSLIWIGGSVAAITLLGVAVGIFLGRDTPVARFTRAFLLVPWVLPGVVAAATWKWMLQSQTGVVNSVLLQLGAIERTIPWLADPKMALYVVIWAMTWRLFPLYALVVAAACRTVDQALYEAADMDGATFPQKVRFVMLPAILPQIITMSLLATIWVANNIVFIQVMTGGGPFDATHTLPTLLFVFAFEANQMGPAAAVTAINAVLLVLIAVAYIQAVRRSERQG